MIDIGFIPYWAPIIFGFLSYCSNTLFVWIVSEKSRSSFGAYKYMLISFGVFDILYSTVDMVVAMGSHSEGNTFCAFVSHGPFADNIEIGFIALCVRGMFFSTSYGVLEVHFIYRYIALCKPKWIFMFSDSKWIILLVLGVLGQSFFWFFSIYFLMWPDEEMRSYLAVPFQRDYNVDVQKVPLLGATYWGASANLILRSSIGMLNVSTISCFTIYFCVWTGLTIYKTLKTVDMSINTRKMHRNLLTALAIQTFIPFAISYIPCMVAWIVPIIHVDLKGMANFTAIVAVAAFPFIDPLAIMLLLPDYRNALLRIILPCFYPRRTMPENFVAESSGRS